jgi:hypothetical protein
VLCMGSRAADDLRLEVPCKTWCTYQHTVQYIPVPYPLKIAKRFANTGRPSCRDTTFGAIVRT